MKEKLLHIDFAGGVIPVSALRRVAMAGISHGAGCIYAGDRQYLRLAMHPPAAYAQVRALLQGIPVHTPEDGFINVYSNAAPGTQGTAWLSGGRFRSILEQFKEAPRIAVDILDPRRPVALPGHGNLRFYAHPEEDFWVPAIRTAKSEGLMIFPGGIRSGDLTAAAGALEPVLRWRRRFDAKEYIDAVARAVPGGLRPLILSDLTAAPVAHLGFNGADSLCLPLGTRPFSCRLLEALCVACIRHGIVQVSLTLRRELVFSGLDASARRALELELLRFRWRPDPLSIDTNVFFTDRFIRAGRRAHALLAQIQDAVSPYSGLRAACRLQGGPLPETEVLLVLHPPSPRLLARQRVSLYHQTTGPGHWGNGFALIAECRAGAAGERLRSWIETRALACEASITPQAQHSLVHSCGECQSQYDGAYGDPLGGVAPGTPFDALAPEWCCPVCSASKAAYELAAAAV